MVLGESEGELISPTLVPCSSRISKIIPFNPSPVSFLAWKEIVAFAASNSGVLIIVLSDTVLPTLLTLKPNLPPVRGTKTLGIETEVAPSATATEVLVGSSPSASS